MPPTLLPELAPYWTRYTAPEAQAATVPLLVVMDVAGPVAGYDPPTLDGLLARMVVDEALGGTNLDDSGSPYRLPVPLQLAWIHPESGMPLWRANPFTPVGEHARTTIYRHKRMIRPEHARRQKGGPTIQATAGRHKELRIPMPAVACARWAATCVGEAAEVARLLAQCSAVGKRRMGRVTAWHVVPWDEPFRFARPVPAAYLGREGGDVYAGWTPPYWPGVPQCQTWCVSPS